MSAPAARVLAALLVLLAAGPTAAQSSGVHHRYAPFVDATAWPLPDLDGLAAASGARGFVLGFVVNDAFTGAACTPKWGGFTSYHATAAQADAAGEPLHLADEIAAFRAAGGRPMLSFGGAANTPVEATCADAASLAAALEAVADAYGVYDLDFDVEGAWVSEGPSLARRAAALTLLQAQRPEVRVWFTLPVLPGGLTADGVAVVRTAVQAGVAVSGVNVMAMNYGEGPAPDPSQLGTYAIEALTNVHAQVRTVYADAGQPLAADRAWAMLGVTPMVGVNDLTREVFTLAHAADVEAFARARGLGLLSMWSIARDRACAGGPGPPVQAGCSGVAQEPYAFSAIFGPFDDTPTAAEEPAPPSAFALSAPTPNPARGSVRLILTLAETQAVRVEAFDGLGRRVAGLHDGALAAGRHVFTLDAARLTAGLYVVRAVGATGAAARRVSLLR